MTPCGLHLGGSPLLLALLLSLLPLALLLSYRLDVPMFAFVTVAKGQSVGAG